jgi:hypothetical protein
MSVNLVLMAGRFFAQKGIAHLIPLLFVWVIVIAGFVVFLTQRQPDLHPVENPLTYSPKSSDLPTELKKFFMGNKNVAYAQEIVSSDGEGGTGGVSTGYGRPAKSYDEPGCYSVINKSNGYGLRCFQDVAEEYWFNQVYRMDSDFPSGTPLNHPLSEAEIARVGAIIKQNEAKKCAFDPSYCADIPEGFESINDAPEEPADESLENDDRINFAVNPFDTLLNFRKAISDTIFGAYEGITSTFVGETASQADARKQQEFLEFWKDGGEAVTEEVQKLIGSSKEELESRQPVLSDEDVALVKQSETPVSQLSFRADIVEGDIQILRPGTTEYVDLGSGEIPVGSKIFTGFDSTLVVAIKDVGVMEVLPFTEVTFTDEGIAQAAVKGEVTDDKSLRTGEVEVNIEGGLYQGAIQVETSGVVAGVRGTHFWVKHNAETDATLVGVYEGEVEVASKQSGKSVFVTPDKDGKPGIVLVKGSKGFSSQQLIIGIVVLTVVLGGIVWFIKRRKK